MDANEIDALLAELRAGRAHRVPFSTTLGGETTAVENVLRARDDGSFELTTTYREFAPGHGWSTDLHEIETRSEAQVREALVWVARDDVAPR